MQYEKRLIEFLNIEDIRKFNPKNNVLFLDGKSAANWFASNKGKIFRGEDNNSRLITLQYNQYLQISFEKDLEEFSLVEDIKKFSQFNKSEFKDGRRLGIWFIKNKKKIFNTKNKHSNLIKSQYEEYKKSIIDEREEKKDTSYQKRLIEFCEINDLLKFSRHHTIRFKDGTLTFSWFSTHKKKILDDNDEYSKLIKKQFKEFCDETPLERKKHLEDAYEEKLIEFCQIDDLRKFSQPEKLKFSDGKVAHSWFSLNKKRIFESNDEYSKLIVLQYEEYKKSFEVQKENKYEEKLRFFAQLEDSNKFLKFNNLKFPDGSSCSWWFCSNKKKIFESTDESSLLIILQYEEYKKDIKNKNLIFKQSAVDIINSKKKYIEEFLNIEDMTKFDYGSPLKLSNGEYAYEWFVKARNYILESKDPNCIKTKEQYEAVINKRRLKNSLEFKKDELCFLKLNHITKFNIYSTYKLPSGIESGLWFKCNKEFLLKSKGPVEKEIKKQYQSYRDFSKLLLEFYKMSDLSKFDYDSDLRFSTGALMSMWWEVRKEEILNDDFFLYVYIQEQYEKYCKNNGIAYTKKSFEKK